MNRDKNRLIIIAVLIVVVVVMSIGFAAFANSLKIKSGAKVNPDASDFLDNFGFSTSGIELKPGKVDPIKSQDVILASNATLTNTTVSDISVVFNDAAQQVEYHFFIYNGSSYTAYLNKVMLGNPTCTAIEGTNASSVAEACKDLSIAATIDWDMSFTSSDLDISSKPIAPGANMYVIITVKYASGAEDIGGDFTVRFSDTIFEYGTVD